LKWSTIYNYMTGGLVLTGMLAFFGATSGIYASIAGTPLFWLVLLAPLGLVMFLSFRLENMGLVAAQISFWLYAALVGLSLSGVFLIYTGESIARVFVVSAATYGATSIYGYTTRADLSRFGSFLFMSLIGIVTSGASKPLPRFHGTSTRNFHDRRCCIHLLDRIRLATNQGYL
jgi:FtsH-binding integral membrane protein